MRERGFTLIELVLVLLVATVVGIVVSTNLSGFPTIKVNGAARKLASDIRFAQQMAITQQVKYGVAVNVPVANKYTVYKNDDPTVPARDPAGGNNFIVDFTTGQFQGVTLSSTLPVDGSARKLVKFDSQGQPLGGGGSALAGPNNTITLSYSGATAVVTIAPTTGRVTY